MDVLYRIRGHTLLCLQGFRGEGYSPQFIARMRAIHADLAAHPDTLVIPTDCPDVFCECCPHLRSSGCNLPNRENEDGMVNQDRVVLSRLGLTANTPVPWVTVLERIAATTAGSDLPGICGNCPWLPLGYCSSGLSDLRKS
jgi:hypothetical protein